MKVSQIKRTRICSSVQSPPKHTIQIPKLICIVQVHSAIRSSQQRVNAVQEGKVCPTLHTAQYSSKKGGRA